MADRKKIIDGISAAWKATDRERSIKTAGTSMTPLIREGDNIAFQPLKDFRRPYVGDIAVFERDGCLVVHRIVDRWSRDGRHWLKEKGDNRFMPRVIPEDCVVGIVVRIEKGTSAIELDTARWRFLNRVIGYYWKVLFTVLEVLRSFWPARSNTGRHPILKSISCFLISLPARMFRSR